MEFGSKQILNRFDKCHVLVWRNLWRISKLTTKCSKALSHQIDSQLYYSVICNKCMIFTVNPVLHKPNCFKKKKCKFKNLKHYTSVSELLHYCAKFKSFSKRKKLRNPAIRSLKVLSIRHCSWLVNSVDHRQHCSLETIQKYRFLLPLCDRRKNIGNFRVS